MFDDAMLKAIVFTGLAAALLGVIYGWYRLRNVICATIHSHVAQGNLKSKVCSP